MREHSRRPMTRTHAILVAVVIVAVVAAYLYWMFTRLGHVAW